MNRVVMDYELREDGQPKRSPGLLWILDTMLGFILMPLTVFSSAVMLGILLRGFNIPIAKILGYPIGFVMLFVAWSVSFCTASLFLGKFSFTNSLFSVLKIQAFPHSQFFIVLALFVSKFLYSLLKHGNLHFNLKMALLAIMFFMSSFNVNYMVSYAKQTALTQQIYWFYFIEFVLFAVITVLDFGKL